ncbi:hypothetical protein Tco_0905070 [Tanacetum coccineum]
MSVVKTILEACIHAIALDGREGVSLKVLSWRKVAKALQDNHNFETHLKQMRNHFDYMKLKNPAKNKRKQRQLVDGAEKEILGVLKIIAGKILKSQPLPKPKTPTLEDCQSKLKVLGWLEDHPLYNVALAIFCDPNDRYKEGWMQLKRERCISWVKMIGCSKGFM